MARILVIDDDLLVRKSLSRVFCDQGHEVFSEETLAAGVAAAEEGVDVVFLDLDLPDGNGLQAIDALCATAGHPEVVVITGMGSDHAALKSMESRAWEYIAKPASPAVVLQVLDSALTYRLEAKKEYLAGAALDTCGLIGESPAMVKSLHEIGKAAASDASVLIRGETGVGKELMARAVHENSARKNGPFVVVDCSGLASSLVESILYGHEKGAFTGASADRQGLVAQADGGTLFLDEVGELAPEQQKSFLRVLQERKFRPVGAGREISSDFRLVAATNRDLGAMVAQGSFRSDLLYRLRTVEVVLPPLRERGEDVRKLAGHFIERTCDRYGLDTKKISTELIRVVGKYSWPGNVRELMNVMEAAVIAAGMDSVIYPKHLPGQVRMEFLGRAGTSVAPAASVTASRTSTAEPVPQVHQEQQGTITAYADYKKDCDRSYFERLLTETAGNIPRASEISGLSVPSVYRYLSQVGIPTKIRKRQ